MTRLTYDERVEMLRLADDLAHGEIDDLDTQQMTTIIRALRACGADGVREDGK